MKYKLSDICEIKVGYPFKSKFFNNNGEGVRLVRGMNVSKNGLRWGNQTRWWSNLTEELKEYYLKTDDVLIAMDGNVSTNFALIKKEDLPLLLVQRVACLRSKVVPQQLIWYIIKTHHFSSYMNAIKTGTTISHVSAHQIGEYEIDLPDLDTQKKIGALLRTLDNKIEKNNAINDNLQQQAQAIFKAWFVDYIPWNGNLPKWEQGILSDYVAIKRGGSPRPIQDYLSESGYRWLKISDVTSLQTPFITSVTEYIKASGISKTVFLKSGSLVLSNSATPGIPKILDLDSCIHDGWLYFPYSEFSNEFLYLLFLHIRSSLVALGNGSVFTNLKTDILKAFPIIKPPEDVLNSFDKIVKPIFMAILHNTREINSLALLRDTLLPRLMSGEIDVSKVKINT